MRTEGLKGSGIALVALALAGSAWAAGGKAPLFAGAEPLQLVLSAPLVGLRNAKQPGAGTLTVVGSGTMHPITVNARGITRRMSDICAFPPIRVTFTPPPAAPSPFGGQKELKLVTHCRTDVSFQQHLLLEYAAYRMYNLLTPLSYQVRLAQIDYRTESGKPLTNRLGFFIEDTSDLAKRNGLRTLKTTARVSPLRLSPVDAARFALFADMIGNLDWSMIAGPAGTECCHNAKLLGAKDGTGQLVPLSYDYDFSGLVDAPYATPPEGISLPNVRERRYRGYCRHEREARAEVANFLAKRAELIGVLDQIPSLQPATRAKAAAYLGGFFEQIGSERGLAKMFSTCVS